MTNKQRIKVGLGFTDERLKSTPPGQKRILKAMIHNYAYDIQSEGERAYYAERLFLSSNSKEQLAQDFMAYLVAMPSQLYAGHKQHVLHVAARLVARGYTSRDQVIETVSAHYALEDNDLHLEVLWELGKEGTVAYLELHGAAHAKRKFWRYYPYEEGNRQLLDLIAKHGIDSDDLSPTADQFLTDLKAWKREEKIFPPRFSDFADYLKYIRKETFVGRATAFFQSFTMEQLNEVEHRLVHATSEDELIGLMAPLVENGLRGPYSHLLPYVTHDHRRIRRQASNILATIESAEVRQLALDLIATGRYLKNAIVLLASNLQPQDDALIHSALKDTRSKHTLHDCGYALMHAEGISKKGLLKKSFNHIFYTSRCGVCRSTIVKEYLATTNLPTEEQAALKFDSFAATRAMPQFHPTED